MRNRDEMQQFLETEKQRWAAKPVDSLIAELHSVHNYEVVTESGNYQVEVQLLENRPDYLHVSICIDDGHLPTSIVPMVDTFILRRSSPQ